MRKIDSRTSGWARRAWMSDEEAEECDGGGQDTPGLHGVPADLRGPDDAVHRGADAGGDGERTPAVDGPAPCPGACGHQLPGGGDGDQRDRDVDEEHPWPGQVFGDDTAEEHSGGAAGGGGCPVQGQRLGQFTWLGPEQHHQQGQRGGCDQRGSGALDGATGQFDADGAGQAGDGGPDQQDGPAGGEDAAGAEQVGQSPAEQQQTAERDDVGVEHPGQVLLGEAEVGLHLGQGDPDDRGVHDDHELGGGDEPEGPPPPVGGCGLGGHEVLLTGRGYRRTTRVRRWSV